MITRILLALDASERAAAVASQGAVLAMRFGATLFPFRAIMIPIQFPAAGAGAKIDLLPQTMIRTNEAALRALVSHIVQVDLAPPMIRVGEPARAILAASEELDVDMIVMGSHGYGGWDRLLGTTAGAVVNRATCSVFVVRENLRTTATTDPMNRRKVG